MTAAFDSFVDQYNAEGNAKWQGYSAEHFDGIQPHEVARARALLERELWMTPGMAANGLRYLGDDVARGSLLKFLSAGGWRVEGVDEVYYHLWELTANVAYQRDMMHAYPACPPADRPAFQMRLAETPNTPACLEFFRERVLDVEDPIERHHVATAWLVRVGVPYKGEDARKRFDALLAEINEEDAGRRAEALVRIERRLGR